MNVKLLKQVRDYIVEHPEKYNQASYCGTACCVAGHAALLSGIMQRKYVANQIKADTSLIRTAAKIALDLNDHQAERLFHPTWGPCGSGQYRISIFMKPAARSALAVKRINHFIETKGAE